MNLKQKYEDDDDDDNDDCDSDNETNDQVRRRILKQRHAEILRRELEEQERQVISLSVERFAVPEVLFRPSDIGLRQVGIAEGICQSTEAYDPIYRAVMYHNVILTGGTVQLPHFKERLQMELRALAPSNYEIRVYIPDYPVNYAWKGAQDLFQSMNGFSTEGYLDRLKWKTKKKADIDTGDIWDSKNGNKTCEGHILFSIQIHRTYQKVSKHYVVSCNLQEVDVISQYR